MLPHWATLSSVVRISLGGIAQFLVATASWIFLVQIVSSFGNEAVAGYTIGVRIVMFTILLSWGLSLAASTSVCLNLGAGSPARAELSVWQIVKFIAFSMVFALLMSLFCATPLVGIFIEDSAASGYAVQALWILALGYIPWGIGTAIIQSFNGAGDTMTPTWINVFCFWLVQVTLAYSLAMLLELGSAGLC